MTDFIFWGSKIIVDGDCSHEIKRHLLLGRKAMINLDSILKSKYITMLIKIRLVKAKVFPVIMYGCENWSIKKAEHWRIDASEPWWCWRRLLRVPCTTARRSSQSILKEISPGCCVLRKLFHSPLSLSSRSSLVHLAFCHKGGVIFISEVINISTGNLDSSLCFIQPDVSHDVCCMEVK